MARKPKLPKITWWAFVSDPKVMIHARIENAPRTICGGEIDSIATEVRGPKTIAKRKKCQRCDASIERKKRMLGIH